MKCKICGKETSETINGICYECHTKDKPIYLMGWECPRCRKIHSPYSTECNFDNQTT